MAAPRSGRSAMAEAARSIDMIDTAPPFTAEDAARLNARFEGVDSADMLRELLTGELTGRTAVVSSFGAESAVLLHLVAQVDTETPVIFVNTQKMFGETLAYRDELSERLGFVDLRVFRPDPRILAERDKTGLRWSYDPDGCCGIRKVEPLRRALAPFQAWISGRKGFQSGTRTALPRFEIDEGRLKLNPLADWPKERLEAYFHEHDLPRHPLEAQGYLSIGCAPCTSVVKPGEDPRAGRWRGWDKVECGIHGGRTPGPDEEPVF
ncbi:Thioredoxin-dependent 5'-adenylylsulfate reductase [Sphingomonas haloaromaticamans]|uniref:Adenosine 5'-phosphosulfate reductase n=2 Tax=Edaphosphingomonas haloaromaticamans TaxID=653954 RepID=A0A1S1HCU7_9SPHN|nr:Thioredoxin-dependent 5'-adenylylsulfate reductase [Sphingomonas haloaromaticamans]